MLYHHNPIYSHINMWTADDRSASFSGKAQSHALSRLGLVVRSRREDLQIGKKLWLSIRDFMGGSINGVPLNGWFILENPIKNG